MAVLSVRAAVDVEKRGIALAGDEAGRAHHPDVQLEAGAREPEPLGRRERHRVGPATIQPGEPALVASVEATHEDLGGRHRPACREGDQPAVGRCGEPVHRALAADGARGSRAARRGHTPEADVTALLGGDRDEPTIR